MSLVTSGGTEKKSLTDDARTSSPGEHADGVIDERMQLAVEATGLGTFDWDVETDVMKWSDKCKTIFGLAPEDSITYEKFLTALLHPDDRDRVDQIVRRSLDPRGSGKYDTEYRAVWPDGRLRWIAARGHVFFSATSAADGVGEQQQQQRRPVRFIGTVVDITDRKAAHDELRENVALYRALTDAMPQMVFVTDAEGSHLYYNRRWYDYTGLTEEESMGFGFANALHPDDKEPTLRRWRRAWEAGEPYEVEYRFYSKPQGVYRWFLGRAQPVRDANGAVTRWVGTCTDIEDQKRMEDDLARAAREREQMLEEISTPIVPVWKGVLVLPIIGSLDTARMHRATETALKEVTQTGARACIIDITGARIIDSHAVANLTNLVGALKLIGAEAIVTGVTAHAAQSLVGLGLDFGGMRTRRTLAEALASLLQTEQQKTEGLNGTSKKSR